MNGFDSKWSQLATWSLIASVALVFGQAVFFGFITFDDGAYVFLNQSVIRGLSRESIVMAFTDEVAGNWHPLTMLTHMAVSSLFGPRPWAYHLLNIAIHAANCVLLFKLLQALLTFGRRPSASGADPGPSTTSAPVSFKPSTTIACWFAAGLFALHPLRAESVVWVSELKDLLSALFCLLTIHAYLRWAEEPVHGNYVRLIGYFAAGLMSKPMLVTLPCVLMLLDFWPLKRLGSLSDWQRLGALAWEKLPLFALSAAACLVTIQYQKMGQAVQSLEMFPLTLRLQSATVSYAAYLGKMIWPADLALFYPYPKHWPPLAVASAVAVILLPTLVIVLAARRFPAWFTGWFWYLGTLVPVIGLVQVGKQSMADRYTYIPSMGVSLMIAWTIVCLLERQAARRTWARVLAVASIAILTCLSVLAWKQVALWRSSEALYRHTLRVTGENWFMRQTLAMLLAHTNRVDEGIEELREALRIDPGNAGIWDDLGYLLQLKGNMFDAVQALQETIRLDPSRASAHRVLAGILRQQGKVAGAIDHLRESIRLLPSDSQSLVALARIRASHPEASVRNSSEALALARKACELSRYQDPDALDALAAAHAENRQFDLAFDFARRGAESADSSGKSTQAGRIRKRMALYEMHIPLRESR